MPIRWLTIFLDFPAGTFGRSIAFWPGVTAGELSPWRGTAGEFATLLPPEGDAYLRVQRVVEGNGGCHLDLHVDLGDESLDDAAARATTLGAGMWRRDDDLVVARSPGGFTFCLVPWDGETRVPAPLRLDGGGASRADQLCLDIPPGAYERECSFWAGLTGWDLRSGGRPEFAYLAGAGMPVRILLQRREQAGAGDPVTAHVDFACSDARKLAERHAALGSRLVRDFSDWLAMADPAGRPYCLTARRP
jgi:hypothetical protein